MRVGRQDEGEHPIGEDRQWLEAHRLDVFCSDARAALSLMVVKHPGLGRASFVAAYLREDLQPIVLSELDIALPSDRWEIRASGLWADHTCETPLDHWSYGLEAFALAIDDPSELLGAARGDRVPLGWELEFEASQEAVWLGRECYQQVGAAHGIVLTEDGETTLEGAALRTHWWGTGGPIELHVGQTYRPVHTRVRLPSTNGIWSLDMGSRGMRIRNS